MTYADASPRPARESQLVPVKPWVLEEALWDELVGGWVGVFVSGEDGCGHPDGSLAGGSATQPLIMLFQKTYTLGNRICMATLVLIIEIFVCRDSFLTYACGRVEAKSFLNYSILFCDKQNIEYLENR